MTDEALDRIVAVHTEQLTQQARLFEEHCTKQNHNLERIWMTLDELKAASAGRISKFEAGLVAMLASLVVGLVTYLATH